MSVLRKIQRVGKRATKFQYTATYQSVLVECQRDVNWMPNEICVAWSRRGRRLLSCARPWQSSPDNKKRGVVVWPEPEVMEITVTLYKGPKDKSYETKEWDFAIIDVDSSGKRKVLGTTSINMVRYASSLPYDHDLHLRLKPVSRKIKKVILEVSITSMFLREGKATDDDMMSIASQMSVSNLSTIGFLEDEEDDNYLWGGGRSITPPTVPDSVLSTDALLKWSQEVTRSYPGVKISNMTTSWRNGLGFLAIMHYYRPDLLDFDMIPPNSIKENNRLVCELAQSLGISCPINPNMMLTSTVPDKLSVTSFVYQMHQYFTRATISAISRNKQNLSGQQSPVGDSNKASPFDLSAFDRFTFDKLSPVATPQGQGDRAFNIYSRHSRNSSQGENVPSEVPLSPIQSSESANISRTAEATSGSSSAAQTSVLQSTPKAKEGSDANVESVHVSSSRTERSEVSVNRTSPENVATNQIETYDNRSTAGAPASFHHDQGSELAPVTNGYNIQEVASSDNDRALEFENLGESEEEPTTGSSCSLEGGSSTQLMALEEERSRAEQPVERSGLEQDTSTAEQEQQSAQPGGDSVSPQREGEEGIQRSQLSSEPPQGSENAGPEHTGEASKCRRKLPAIPTDQAQPAEDKMKREERRRRAKEMLKQAHVKGSRSSFDSSTTSIASPAKDPDKERYREKAKQLLSEAIGTPKSERKSEKAQSSTVAAGEMDTSLTSEGSSTSVSTYEESPILPPRQQHKPKEQQVNTAKPKEPEVRASSPSSKKEPSTKAKEGPSGRKQVNTAKPKEPEVRASSPSSKKEPSTKTKEGPSGRKQVNTANAVKVEPALVNGEESTANQDVQYKRRGSAGAADRSKAWVHDSTTTRHESLGQRPASASNPASRQKQKQRRPVKTLPVAKPVSSRPSQAVKLLAQQKMQKPPQPQNEPDGREKGEQGPRMQNGEVSGEAEERVDAVVEGGGSVEALAEPVPQTPVEELSVLGEGSLEFSQPPTPAVTLESPSAWSQHSENLSEDILVTQSEFIRGELVMLQEQLQKLEDRASNIEADIRNAMSIGDKEEEESLMQEWFGLLNYKNELIKRQIELNLIEKEEDLEKRQFFLNRELRPLMEIPEDQKSPEQQDRAAHLLRELLDLIDERDKLERRKMTAERDADFERGSFAAAHSKATKVVHSKANTSQSKECVIS